MISWQGKNLRVNDEDVVRAVTGNTFVPHSPGFANPADSATNIAFRETFAELLDSGLFYVPRVPHCSFSGFFSASVMDTKIHYQVILARLHLSSLRQMRLETEFQVYPWCLEIEILSWFSKSM